LCSNKTLLHYWELTRVRFSSITVFINSLPLPLPAHARHIHTHRHRLKGTGLDGDTCHLCKLLNFILRNMSEEENIEDLLIAVLTDRVTRGQLPPWSWQCPMGRLQMLHLQEWAVDVADSTRKQFPTPILCFCHLESSVCLHHPPCLLLLYYIIKNRRKDHFSHAYISETFLLNFLQIKMQC